MGSPCVRHCAQHFTRFVSLKPFYNPTRQLALVKRGSLSKWWGGIWAQVYLATLQVRTSLPRSSPPLPLRHQDSENLGSHEKGRPKFLVGPSSLLLNKELFVCLSFL